MFTHPILSVEGGLDPNQPTNPLLAIGRRRRSSKARPLLSLSLSVGGDWRSAGSEGEPL